MKKAQAAWRRDCLAAGKCFLATDAKGKQRRYIADTERRGKSCGCCRIWPGARPGSGIRNSKRRPGGGALLPPGSSFDLENAHALVIEGFPDQFALLYTLAHASAVADPVRAKVVNKKGIDACTCSRSPRGQTEETERGQTHL
ncbi:hypothetical protein SBA3_1750023 [Candidatus Sulfopaludibacter sp. SbA3]|nr:hypothetical protein SBA3_1750023 [Candidatus Sulfopaludibacter sp. SbA3]